MRTVRTSLAVASVTLFLVAARSAIFAAGLPQIFGADEKARQGGLTGAAASLTGTTGSALEPYLITFLLPVFGLVMFGMSVYVDRLMRRSARAR